MGRKTVWLTLLPISFLVTLTPTVPVKGVVVWSDETPLTTYKNWDILPSITQMSDGRIWVVWQSNRVSDFDIYYKIYNWTSWTSDAQLISDLGEDVNPSIFQSKNGIIWLFWASNRTGNYDIFYKTSSDNGKSWTASNQLTSNTNYDTNPSVVQAGDGAIWVVWVSNRTGDDEIFYRIYDGSSWSDEMPLTTVPGPNRNPSISVMNDGRIWVVWDSYRTEDFEIFYKINNGTSWSNETQLTTSPNLDVNPEVFQDRNGAIWVVWASREPTATATDDLYYKTSFDNGVTWSDTVQLTSHPDDDMWPSVAQISDKKIWVVWVSNRNYNYDLYYKTSSEILIHDVATTKATPSSIIVGQGENLTINIVVENQGELPETFIVTTYANTTTIGTQTVTGLAPGTNMTLIFTWNTAGVPYGNYTIRATASIVPDETDTADNIVVDGKVFVTIPGDIDGNGRVDADDLYMFSGAYGTNFGHPAYAPMCDLDHDGHIGPDDFYIFSGNYGKHI